MRTVKILFRAIAAFLAVMLILLLGLVNLRLCAPGRTDTAMAQLRFLSNR